MKRLAALTLAALPLASLFIRAGADVRHERLSRELAFLFQPLARAALMSRRSSLNEQPASATSPMDILSEHAQDYRT